MMFNFYKALWSRIGGRPWTYIIRDFVYRNPLLMVILFAIVILALLHQKHEIFYVLIGVLLGHLFWGTRYIPDQKEDEEGDCP